MGTSHAENTDPGLSARETLRISNAMLYCLFWWNRQKAACPLGSQCGLDRGGPNPSLPGPTSIGDNTLRYIHIAL